jgi:hypothetical protein
LEISTKPEGCAIWINGDLRPEVTPAKIEKLPFNRKLELKLTKEGLEAYRESVTLERRRASKKVDAEMKTGSVTVLLKIDPPPTVWLDGKPWKGDRTRSRASPRARSTSSSSPPTASRRRPWCSPPSKARRRPSPRPWPRPIPTPRAATRVETKPATPAGGSAKVRVGAKGGFCTVTVNGSSYGPTPVEAVVSAGTVRVSCKPASGPSMSQVVTVAAGDTARVSFKVDQ